MPADAAALVLKSTSHERTDTPRVEPPLKPNQPT